MGIHLRFSVETPNVRIMSYEPAEGRVVVVSRRPCWVELRLPDGEQDAWVVFEDTRSALALASPRRDGYVRFRVEDGQRAEVLYRLVERTARYEMGSPPHTQCCLGHWRGETLMQVEAEGEFCPLYTARLDLPPVEPARSAQPAISSL